MLKSALKERNLLPILTMNDGSQVTLENWELRRKEMLEALMKYSYGHTPPAPKRVWGERLKADDQFTNTYAGKVRQERIMIHFETEQGICSFPFVLAIPLRYEKPPVFLHIANLPDIPSRFLPVEEITDAGYAIAIVYYEDMVNDNHFGDYSDGVSAHFGTTNPRSSEEWGKIGMWAYGTSRVLDYLLTRDDIDVAHTAVVGHSRLGKTALWTAAQDERFFAAISNNSGYGGAATSKHGTGERITDFLRVGSWDWFCENFKNYTGEKEDLKPYDQAYLLALIAPRYLCVGSAIADRGADPTSEFLTSLWASQAWELHGKPGLITPDRMPVPGEAYFEGNVGYQLRLGKHFLSREDWNRYIEFMNLKIKGTMK